MQQDLTEFPIEYLVGNEETFLQMQCVSPRSPFDEYVMDFLNQTSHILLSNAEAKRYSDIVTFAFWIRRASLEQKKRMYMPQITGGFCIGRGIVFHVAPSNVAVNYAYSLAIGLLSGNVNIVRVPSKSFEQIDIINAAFRLALEKQPEMKKYILLVRYGHDKKINDLFSLLADVRIVWGGDRTIQELRKCPLKPRAVELTFADRCSLAVIDVESYLAIEDKAKIALDFYNDTYLSDQNACTAPRIVIWMGENSKEASAVFWKELHKLVETNYELHGVQAVDKLTNSYMLAASYPAVRKAQTEDNLIVHMYVERITAKLLEYTGNSGYFLEMNCDNLMELQDLCCDSRIQTIAYIGKKEMFGALLQSGIKGVDRIVPIGRTMDFDLVWDGYRLMDYMTRTVMVI